MHNKKQGGLGGHYVKGYWGYFTRAMVLLCTLLASSQPVLAGPIELSMEDSIAWALTKNPAIKIAEAGMGKAQWAVNEAKASKGPSLNLIHTDSRYNDPPSSTGYAYYTYYTKFDNQIALSLPVYTGGKLESQIDEAKLNLTVADSNVNATKQQIKLSAITAYFDALQYRNQLLVNHEATEDLNAHLKNVEAQYGAGTVSKLDVLYSQVQLLTAQDSLMRAQNNYDNAVANLNNVIGLPHGTELKLKEDFNYEKSPLILEECIKYALDNRPEVLEAQTKVSIAQADITIAQSGYAPTVSLKGTQDWYDQDLPGAKNHNWMVSLTASLNVFDSGLTESQSKQARYNMDGVKEQARQTRDSIALEVRQYYHSMREAEKRIGTNKLAVEQAEENFKIAEIGYSAGINTNLGVIDAQTALTQVKSNYIQTLYDYNTNKAQLEKAMGVPVK